MATPQRAVLATLPANGSPGAGRIRLATAEAVFSPVRVPAHPPPALRRDATALVGHARAAAKIREIRERAAILLAQRRALVPSQCVRAPAGSPATRGPPPSPMKSVAALDDDDDDDDLDAAVGLATLAPLPASPPTPTPLPASPSAVAASTPAAVATTPACPTPARAPRFATPTATTPLSLSRMSVADMVRELVRLTYSRQAETSEAETTARELFHLACSPGRRASPALLASPPPGVPVSGLGVTVGVTTQNPCLHGKVTPRTSWRRVRDLVRAIEDATEYPVLPPPPPAALLPDDVLPGHYPARPPTAREAQAAVAEIQPGLDRMMRTRKAEDAHTERVTRLKPARQGRGGAYDYVRVEDGVRVSHRLYEERYLHDVHQRSIRVDEDRARERALFDAALRLIRARRLALRRAHKRDITRRTELGADEPTRDRTKADEEEEEGEEEEGDEEEEEGEEEEELLEFDPTVEEVARDQALLWGVEALMAGYVAGVDPASSAERESDVEREGRPRLGRPRGRRLQWELDDSVRVARGTVVARGGGPHDGASTVGVGMGEEGDDFEDVRALPRAGAGRRRAPVGEGDDVEGTDGGDDVGFVEDELAKPAKPAKRVRVRRARGSWWVQEQGMRPKIQEAFKTPGKALDRAKKGAVKPAVDKPVVEKADEDELGVGATGVEEPAVEATAADATAVEASGDEASGVEKLDVRVSAVEATGDEESAFEATGVEKSAVQVSAVEASTVEDSTVGTSAVAAPGVEASTVENPATSLPMAEKPGAEEVAFDGANETTSLVTDEAMERDGACEGRESQRDTDADHRVRTAAAQSDGESDSSMQGTEGTSEDGTNSASDESDSDGFSDDDNEDHGKESPAQPDSATPTALGVAPLPASPVHVPAALAASASVPPMGLEASATTTPASITAALFLSRPTKATTAPPVLPTTEPAGAGDIGSVFARFRASRLPGSAPRPAETAAPATTTPSSGPARSTPTAASALHARAAHARVGGSTAAAPPTAPSDVGGAASSAAADPRARASRVSLFISRKSLARPVVPKASVIPDAPGL